jgi:IclR family acetate operon transcriptional repressor
MALLKIVAARNGLSLSEIAELSGQSASTAYRVLVTLQKHAMVEFDEANQLWRVGVESFRIGNAFLGRTNLVEQSRAAMHSVMTQTGETANLAIVDGLEVVFLSQVETHEPVRAFFPPGTKGPVHSSGIGKAILAFSPGERVEGVLKETRLARFTDKTITTEDGLRTELARIRERGWAVDDEERNVGMRCIAAPIFNAFGEAVAGLSISGPSVRISSDQDERFGALIKKAADGVTQSLGGKRPKGC